jgi:succinate-semialdehyde dehydrogenase/glutarate-semialdehyde dehydrogenase
MGERMECLRRAATLLDRGKHRYAELMLLEMGKPFDDETKTGPLARRVLRETLHQQVRASIERDACCLLGGTVL